MASRNSSERYRTDSRTSHQRHGSLSSVVADGPPTLGTPLQAPTGPGFSAPPSQPLSQAPSRPVSQAAGQANAAAAEGAEQQQQGDEAGGPGSQFVVLVRLPFPRGQFVDPPVVRWDEEKDKVLWSIVSDAGLGGEVEWDKVSKQLGGVPPAFLVQQAAYLYRMFLTRMRDQMRKVSKGAHKVTPTPTQGQSVIVQSQTGPASTGQSGQGRAQNAAAAQSTGPTPEQARSQAAATRDIRIPSEQSNRSREDTRASVLGAANIRDRADGLQSRISGHGTPTRVSWQNRNSLMDPAPSEQFEPPDDDPLSRSQIFGRQPGRPRSHVMRQPREPAATGPNGTSLSGGAGSSNLVRGLVQPGFDSDEGSDDGDFPFAPRSLTSAIFARPLVNTQEPTGEELMGYLTDGANIESMSTSAVVSELERMGGTGSLFSSLSTYR